MGLETRNSRFGWIWLGTFMVVGFIIEINLATNKEFAASAIGPEGTIGYTRELVRGAHAHGNLTAILNLVYGIYLSQVALSERVKNIGSWLAIIGAILMPLGLLGLAFGQVAGGPLTSLGGLAAIGAVLIMVVGHLRYSKPAGAAVAQNAAVVERESAIS